MIIKRKIVISGCGNVEMNEEEKIYDNTTTIDNIKCIQIKGYIYTLNIPDSLWKTNGENQEIRLLNEYENVWRIIRKQDNYIYELSNEDY